MRHPTQTGWSEPNRGVPPPKGGLHPPPRKNDVSNLTAYAARMSKQGGPHAAQWADIAAEASFYMAHKQEMLDGLM